MRELLKDNISLLHRLEKLQPGMSSLQHATGSSCPRLREVSSILTWTYCFLSYCTVRTDDVSLRGLLTYARLDRIWPDLSSTGCSWPHNTLEHPQCKPSCFNIFGISLQQGTFCNLYQEVDHPKEECALQSVQGNTPLSSKVPSQPSSHQSPSHKMRLETLERICTSWNKGRCAYLGTCTFKHKCATCRRFGHRARDCVDTTISSEYKQGTRNCVPQEDKSHYHSPS